MNPHQQGHAGGWMKSSVSQSFLNAKLPFGFVHKQQVFTAALKKNKKNDTLKKHVLQCKNKTVKQTRRKGHTQTDGDRGVIKSVHCERCCRLRSSRKTKTMFINANQPAIEEH